MKPAMTASAILLCGMMWGGALFAHPADVSQLRVRVERDHVDFRFTLNLASIQRVVVVDTNHDNKITFDEINAAAPVMRDFLAKATLVSINNEDSDLGEFVKHECFWPHAADTVITPQDEAQRFVDFNFTKRRSGGVEDVWLGFKVFEQLGDLHVIQCIYQQPGQHDTPVDFSAREPDFLYDAGWIAGDVAKVSVEAGSKTLPPPVSPVWTWNFTALGALAAVCAAGYWRLRAKAAN